MSAALTPAAIAAEPEIDRPVDLCLRDGRLDPAAVGWTRRPLHRCNLSGAWGRTKRWDYWCVTSPPLILSITVANLDYLGLVAVWVRDLERDRVVERNAVRPLGFGIRLPESVGGTDVEAGGAGCAVALRAEPGGTRLLVDAGRGARRIEADVRVALPEGHETLGVVIPWSSERFQYTSKHVARPATGTVRVGGDTHVLGPDAWGTLDYGRGRWPYRTRWNWGAGAGRSGGRVVGLQLGGRWTAGTGMTENAVVVDGRLHKIGEELAWEHGPDESGPWRVRAPASRSVDLRLDPVWVRRTAVNLGVAMHDGVIAFGRWSGTVVAGGEAVAVEEVFGWGEDIRWRW